VEEKAVLDDADDGIEPGCHRIGIFDQKTGTIENQIPFVRDVGFARAIGSNSRSEAKTAKRIGDQGNGHGNDFNGQGETAEPVYLFRSVGNHDKLLGSTGDNFFAQEFAATTLDEGEAGRDFVGAIHGEIESFAFLKSDEGNAVATAEALAIF